MGSVFGTAGVPRDKAKSNFGNKNMKIDLVACFMFSRSFTHINVDQGLSDDSYQTYNN